LDFGAKTIAFIASLYRSPWVTAQRVGSSYERLLLTGTLLTPLETITELK